MDYAIRRIIDSDREAVVDIFNFYIVNSFAAFPEKEVAYEFFDEIKKAVRGNSFYAVETPGKQVVGFGLLKKYAGPEVFDRAAEVSYFIMPMHTHKGLGTKLLALLLEDARDMGVDTLLASISSLNTRSLDFHAKNGFEECGRLKRVGKKYGKDFDVVWMQKFI